MAGLGRGMRPMHPRLRRTRGGAKGGAGEVISTDETAIFHSQPMDEKAAEAARRERIVWSKDCVHYATHVAQGYAVASAHAVARHAGGGEGQQARDGA